MLTKLPTTHPCSNCSNNCCDPVAAGFDVEQRVLPIPAGDPLQLEGVSLQIMLRLL